MPVLLLYFALVDLDKMVASKNGRIKWSPPIRSIFGTIFVLQA